MILIAAAFVRGVALAATGRGRKWPQRHSWDIAAADKTAVIAANGMSSADFVEVNDEDGMAVSAGWRI